MRSRLLQLAHREYVSNGFVSGETRSALLSIGVTSVELEQFLSITTNGA